MNYIRLSIKDLKFQSKNWAKEVDQKYHPDIVIYVAKAGFLIAYQFAEVMNIPLIGVVTVREKGNKLKNFIAPIIRKMPDFIRNTLIIIELKSGIHSKNNKRASRFIDDVKIYDIATIKKVLIIDDSVDTGASIISVKELVNKKFNNADIRIAALNVWEKSKKRVNVDFVLYENSIIKAPMSKDSKEYENFIKEYKNFLDRSKND